MLLPFNLSGNKNKTAGNALVMAGDVGATKTLLALIKVEDNRRTIIREKSYISKEYHNFAEVLRLFSKGSPIPDSVCIGVAGPIMNGKANLTNLHWEIVRDDVAKELGVAQVSLINDLEATAYGLALLEEKDTLVIQKGSDTPSGNAAVIAPGTGLGEAGLYFDGNFYFPFPTEGGHSDFAPRNSLDFELHEYIQKHYGHVSWERLVCGPGLLNIYHFLRDEKKWEEPAWLAEEMKQENPKIITKYAFKNDLCRETTQLFIRYLACESASLVLKLKATGGIFIGGGIAPEIAGLFSEFRFEDFFLSFGRLKDLLSKVPVKIILNTQTALLGAAFYAENYRSLKKNRK